MPAISNQILWDQFGAAIDMLENAIVACPDQLWSDPSRRPEWKSEDVVGFWYVAFHTLFWLDFYLTGSREGFSPPSPFTLDEFDRGGPLPEQPYTKDQLQDYLAHCRRKCRATIAALTEEASERTCKLMWGEVSFAELLLYNMRHVQHHAAQLNLMLRQNVHSAPRWVRKANSAIT